MNCIVQKFGGTSVATIDRIKHVANIIANTSKNGQSVVGVVSAMAGVTNKFINLIKNFGDFEQDQEYDLILSSGEIVTSGLLAIALKSLGCNSRSYTGWQIPIVTNSNYGQASITSVTATNIKKDIQNGVIPIICGFQGVSENNIITTLGRGGSDLTAVAIAAAINADLCEIYSDVDGVYTIDPNIYPAATKIECINYSEMLEMASQGAKVLQEQSVLYAMQNKVKIRVASSFVEGSGTIITQHKSTQEFVGLAVGIDLFQIKVTLHKLEDLQNIIALFDKDFIRAHIFCTKNPLKIKILIDKKKLDYIIDILKKHNLAEKISQNINKQHYASINIIGQSFTGEAEIKLLDLLKNHKIYVFHITSTNNRITIILQNAQLNQSIKIIHKYCKL